VRVQKLIVIDVGTDNHGSTTLWGGLERIRNKHTKADVVGRTDRGGFVVFIRFAADRTNGVLPNDANHHLNNFHALHTYMGDAWQCIEVHAAMSAEQQAQYVSIKQSYHDVTTDVDEEVLRILEEEAMRKHPSNPSGKQFIARIRHRGVITTTPAADTAS